MSDSRYNLSVGLALVALLGLLIAFFVSLIDSHAGEIAAATGAVIGGMAGAGGAYAGVRAAISAESEAEQARREVRIASIRLALYTELRMLASQALIEGRGWHEKVTRLSQLEKKLVTAKLPHPIIYPADADKVGVLTEPEIMNIVRFFSELRDVENLVDSLIQRNDKYTMAEAGLLASMFGHGCDYAAKFMEAAIAGGVEHLPGAEQDAGFIAELKAAISFGKVGAPLSGASTANTAPRQTL